MASRYDLRMEQIRADREQYEAAQQRLHRDDLDRIEESTETINRGMADPLNWLLCIGAIAGIPFTGGLSIIALIVAILRMTAGGKANVQAMQPTTADIAYPGLGLARILGALGSLVILIVLVLLLLAAVAYKAQGGK